MAICISSVLSNAKQILKQPSLFPKKQEAVPKGHIPVYVGEEAGKKRYVVPLSYLSTLHFKTCYTEEEFDFHHPMDALTIPCTEETFLKLSSSLNF